MLKRSSASGIIAFVLLLNGCAGKRYWEYEPLSFKVQTSDPKKMNIVAITERVGPGKYALTATLDWNYDTDETTISNCVLNQISLIFSQVEAVAYRSSSGNPDEYILLPWSIPKQMYKKYTASYYKDILFKNLGHCSNLPQPDNVDPWPRNIYKLEKCVLTGDGLPEIAPQGYYKIIFRVTGEVDWSLELIAKLTTTDNFFG
ncbi:uncharacterized protein [Drosophila virilis]|uniref:Uncharacterized protein n=1 Tax=Drosophila virilis TaxID=7244 RepID=B4LNL1_DROVI|nr:uncharacterized protein LOC6625448 [Drosophila virilis]EDW62191.1 uncharacterized protein Dvir_GJ19884 [Drosophila virilis]